MPYKKILETFSGQESDHTKQIEKVNLSFKQLQLLADFFDFFSNLFQKHNVKTWIIIN